jgi:hypothetical protein
MSDMLRGRKYMAVCTNPDGEGTWWPTDDPNEPCVHFDGMLDCCTPALFVPAGRSNLPESDDGASGKDNSQGSEATKQTPNRLSRDDGEVTVSLSRYEASMLWADLAGRYTTDDPHPVNAASLKLRAALSQAALVEGDFDAQD